MSLACCWTTKFAHYQMFTERQGVGRTTVLSATEASKDCHSLHDGMANAHRTREKTAMNMRRWRAPLAALLLWEAYWGYVYINATIPDEAMAMPAAVLFGGVVPVALITLGTVAALLFRLLIRQRW